MPGFVCSQFRQLRLFYVRYQGQLFPVQLQPLLVQLAQSLIYAVIHDLYHLTALQPVQPYQRQLDLALDRGCKKVLLASSSAVYGLARDRPFVELDVPCPSSQYGVSKLRMENSLEEYRRSGISICCLRIGNVLGADSLWLNKNIASVECPIKLDRFTNGLGPLRSYIEPSTLLDVLIALSHTEARDLPQCLNLANPQPTSMHDILHALGVPWEWKPGSVEASQNIVLNCSLLEKFFSFSDIETSAATMVNNVLKIEGFA